MKAFCELVLVLIIFVLIIFVTISSVDFFFSPVLIQSENEIIIKINRHWTKYAIEGGYYRLEKVERTFIKGDIK